MVAFLKKIYKNQSRCLFVSFCIFFFMLFFFHFACCSRAFFLFALDGDEINWYAFNGRLGSFRGRWVPDIPNSHRRPRFSKLAKTTSPWDSAGHNRKIGRFVDFFRCPRIECFHPSNMLFIFFARFRCQ